MKTIWKYEIDPITEQYIEIPSGATTLCVQTQDSQPCIWAMVNPDNPILKRKIITVGTGHMMPDSAGDYIGTYQINDGWLVFHVFEEA